MSATLTSQSERGPTDSLSGASSAQYTGESGPQIIFIMAEGEAHMCFKLIGQTEARWGLGAHPFHEAFVALSRLPLAELKSYVACHTDCSLGNVNGARGPGPGAGKLVLEYVGSLGGCWA